MKVMRIKKKILLYCSYYKKILTKFNFTKLDSKTDYIHVYTTALYNYNGYIVLLSGQ